MKNEVISYSLVNAITSKIILTCKQLTSKGFKNLSETADTE